jgi:uncharacterized protein YbjT (DUF2867 family)
MSHDDGLKRVLVCGATGYLGRFVVQAFKQSGHHVRVLTRDRERLGHDGPFFSPALSHADYDDVFVGQATDPDTLTELMENIDVVFSCVGISRQRDGLTFDQVDYQANKGLIELAKQAGVKRFVYVSMQGADEIGHLAITVAHEKVVQELKRSGLEYRVVRPCGYFSDMGALYDMAKSGRSFLVGKGENRMNPIHGRDLAQVCVDAAHGDAVEVVAGGPDVMTQRQAAELAFEVAGVPARIHVVPIWLARWVVALLRLVSTQYGDLADFIVTAGEIDGVGPQVGPTTLRSHFEFLRDLDAQATPAT